MISTLPLLHGRKVLITGAASGIGLSAIPVFTGLGAQLFLTDRNGAALALAAESAGGVGYLSGDITSETDCAAIVRRAADGLDGLDGLFHAAGVGDSVRTALDLEIDEWQRIVDINLRGTFLMAREAGRLFIGQSRGAIVTVGSVLGIGGIPRRDAYGPAKAGVIMLTRNLACEWAAAGVRVNCVAPGYIRTPMVDTLLAEGKFELARIEARTPMGRLGKPEEIAEAAAFLLSDMARYVTGATLAVDGGWTAYSGAGDVATA